MATPLPPAVSNLPLSPPPPGVTPNFKNPESRADQIYISAGICLPLILLFAALRIYAKISILKKKRTWDDLTCILGIITGIMFIAMALAAAGGGAYGLHMWDIRIGDFTQRQLVITLLVEVTYGPCIWFIKLSLFVLYLEVFGRLRWLKYCAVGGAIATGLFYFATMITFIVMCGPKDGQSQYSYLSALASEECARSRPLAIIMGIVNVISDLYLIVLPLPAVWSLNLPFGRRFGVSAIFLTGCIACISSILGLVYRVDISNNTDKTWAVIPTTVTMIVEITAGILVCCMPTNAAAFKQLAAPMSSFFKSWSHGTRSGSYGTRSHGRVRSSIELRPMPRSGSSQANFGTYSNEQKVWAGSDGGPEEWALEDRPAPAVPLKDSSIRMKTKIAVASDPREV